MRRFGRSNINNDKERKRRLNMKRIECIFLASCIVVACIAGSGLVTMSFGNQGLTTKNSSQTGSCTPSTVPGSSNPQKGEWPMYRGELNHTGTYGGAAAYAIPEKGSAPFWSYAIGDSGTLRSSPAIANGRIYEGAFNGSVQCVDALTGSRVWSHDTGGSILSSPSIAGGYLYIGAANSIYCLNATTGAYAWMGGTYGSAGYSSPAVADGSVFIGCDYHLLSCFDATSGASNWTFNTTSGTVFSSPAVVNKFVYFGSGYRTGTDYNSTLFCVNATNGSMYWKTALFGYIHSSPAYSNPFLYVGDDADYISCLYASDGSFQWYKKLGGPVKSSPAVAGTSVYVSCDDGYLYNLYYFNGALNWSTYIGASGLSSPAVAGKYIYATGSGVIDGTAYAGVVYCLNATNGNIIWRYGLPDGASIETSPAIAYGRVYVATDNGILYCLPMLMLPPPPTNIQGTPGNGFIDFTWTASIGVGVTNYSMYGGMASGGEVYWRTLGNVTFYHSVGYSNGQPMFFRFSAICAYGEGDPSAEYSQSSANVPGMPAITSAISGNGVITLHWIPWSSNGGRPVTGYKIFQGTSSGGETLLATLGSVTSYASMGLTNGQRYFFKVASINMIGTGANSSEVNQTAGLASAPQSFAAVAGNRRAQLTWSAPADNGGSAITEYIISRGVMGESGWVTIHVPGSSTFAYNDTGLTNGKWYLYYIMAVNGIGNGNWASADAIPAAILPAAPQSLAATVNNGQVTLTWAAPSDDGGSNITAYRIYRGTSAGAETWVANVTNVLTWTDLNVTAGTTYYYKVSAVNAVGEGPRSTETSVAVPSAVPSAVPGYPVLFIIGVLAVGTVALAAKMKRKCKE